MREPAAWRADPGPRLDPAGALAAIRGALRGPADDAWAPPGWLLPHQREGARRIAGILTVFGGALLADAVGLGKTYVGLALATRYRRVTLAVPATLGTQWRNAAASLGITARLVSHEALSRGAALPRSDLIVVDEAHRFRNPATRRYDVLARGIGGAHLLLLTATPVVNGTRDLTELLRLFLPDGALAGLGLPSLAAASARSPVPLMHAALPLVVARTPDVVGLRERIPAVTDGAVRLEPTLEPGPLATVLGALDRLRFPPLGPEARVLLRHHLLLRLSSSAEALAASLRRHRRFVDRAIEAAKRGERLGRQEAVTLLRAAETDQLELALAAATTVPLTTRALRAERGRLDRALDILARASHDPKRDALVGSLAAVDHRRVLVFTVARATALTLAAALGWRRVAVATAAGARIASGTLPLDEALARFAPRARAGGPAPPAESVDVLVATDLASEGLNLQDADLVVHYDLPWNPVRLAQRVGRTVRLGAVHERVTVWWFAPPPVIERRLGALELIRRKAVMQLSLPVPATSVVGRAHLVSEIVERRERDILGGGGPVRGHAVVCGPCGAWTTIRWETRGGPLREVLTVGADATLEAPALPDGLAPAAVPIPTSTLVALRRAVLARGRSTTRYTVSSASRALARQLLSAARAAGTRRDRRLLSSLDAVLARLSEGVAVGAERDLADELRATAAAGLGAWLERHPSRNPVLRAPALETVLAAVDCAGGVAAGPEDMPGLV